MLKFMADFDAIGELVGTLEGIQKVAEEDDQYIEMLLRDAHSDASRDFNTAAVASSMLIPHMFEFGTAGVTPGPIKFAPNDPRAHLWTHEYIGSGKNVEVSFNFRPALSANPRPTTASTGVASKYLKFLSNRKYVFWNKALVMETGMEVNIKAKHGDFLFVPFYGNPSYGKYMNSRGYMMWNSKANGPIRSVPGQNTRGNFGALWDGWWGTTGSKQMGQQVQRNFDRDVRAAFDAAAARSRATELKPVVPGMSRRKKASAMRNTMSTLLSRATGRASGNRR